MRTAGTWSGTWVQDRLGVRLDGPPGADGLDVRDLLGLALRRNPRRAHLLVSTVLGKHVPTDPRLVRAAGLRLGALVAHALGAPAGAGADAAAWRTALTGDVPDGAAAAPVLAAAEAATAAVPAALVVGYAETATGLGHAVADALGAACLHSTRRAARGAPGYAGFEEEHSHATGHQLLPTEPAVLARLADPAAPLVLVDDELSTGRTVANTLRALHARTPRERYVVAALVDVRAGDDRGRLDALAAELGARVDVVALAAGTVLLPDGVLERGAELAARTAPVAPRERPVPGVHEVVLPWPAQVPTTARFGTPPGHAAGAAAADAADALAAALTGARGGAGDVLVLASEELMHAPLLLARELTARSPGPVRFSSTTRSPVLAVDADGYAVRSSLAFRGHDPAVDGAGVRYAHNADRTARGEPPWGALVLVVDSASDPAALRAPDGALAALAPLAERLHLVTLPADDWSRTA
ncbi:phosphoribosyltransferase family protein [Paenibacillus sp. TRM 82003]|nr:phosphoribosyltransferase domain-containing protein [Kineococcus sp. TRM81007]MCI2240183.1 phosphoribosyltransferase family protein [Kineococcus sp. TRM81007]MCI3925508.1 phosphoribosyltransferase family protein [Paenibacillus sp. TRM 82003]